MIHETRLTVPKMDCPAEERLVRMALDGHPEVRGLDVDLAARQVTVLHQGPAEAVVDLLTGLRP